MYIQHIDSFIIAITILTLTPGLDTALMVRNTYRGGFTDGSITSLGICCGLFVHATFSAIGISTILAQSAELFHLIKSIGAIYLIWLGLSSFRSLLNSKNQTHTTNIPLPSSFSIHSIRSFKEGFFSNVLNPKTAVFYFAFLPQFMTVGHSVLFQSWLMAAIHFVIAMIWQCSLSAVLNSAKKLLHNETFIRGMEGITGFVLIFLGVKLLIGRE